MNLFHYIPAVSHACRVALVVAKARVLSVSGMLKKDNVNT